MRIGRNCNRCAAQNMMFHVKHFPPDKFAAGVLPDGEGACGGFLPDFSAYL
jgi:hypothetical protein